MCDNKGDQHSMLNMVTGGTLKLHTFSHSHTKDTGFSMVMASGSLFSQIPDSVQNGLLLASDMHQLIDGYDISINPDASIPVLNMKFTD